MKKRKILFLIHTEYHMMVALSIIDKFYIDNERFTIDIYQTYNEKKKRFLFEKDVKLLEHLNYHVIEYYERKNSGDSILRDFIIKIIDSGYNEFILFNHHMFVPIYLAKKLFLKGTSIHLAPDGLKAYNVSRKITPRWSFGDAIKFYKFCRSNKLPYVFHYPTLTYANLKEIDKVYVPFKETFKNFTNKKVEEFDLLKSKRAVSLATKFFKFDISKELLRSEKIVFYINQPLINKEICNYELEVLNYMLDNFKDYRIVVKVHPLTDKQQLEKISALKNIEIVKKTYPAELYIASLNNSIVLSFWSTACLLYNKYAKIYWLYPALIRKRIMLDYVKVSNPTKHIIEVDGVEKIG